VNCCAGNYYAMRIAAAELELNIDTHINNLVKRDYKVSGDAPEDEVVVVVCLVARFLFHQQINK